MAEIIGLTASAITLASLFNNCIACFDLFQAAQRTEDDFKLLQVKLDLEKTRMLIWANTFGLFQATEEGRSSALTDLVEKSIRGCLEQIQKLLLQADNVEDQYGLRPAISAETAVIRPRGIVSRNSMGVFKATFERFCVRVASSQNRPRRLLHAKWAVFDRAKFEGLLVHLRDFVDGLYQVLPVPGSQSGLLAQDISSILEIENLRLVEAACEDVYPDLSEVASVAILASEAGTSDRRNMEEMLEDLDALAVGQEEGTTPSSLRGDTEQFFSDKPYSRAKLFFVMTEPCSSEQPCGLNDLGHLVLDQPSSHSFSTGSHRKWNLGFRITRIINMQDFDYEIEERVKREQELDLESMRQGTEFHKSGAVAQIFVYCAPCVCAIHTALELCRGWQISSYLEFFVRIDERLPVSCCQHATRREGMTSLLHELDFLEADPTSTPYKTTAKNFDLLDRPWIEKCLYDLEDEPIEVSQTERHTAFMHQLAADHQDLNKLAGIVILAETLWGTELMLSQLSDRLARMPVDNEIYMIRNPNTKKPVSMIGKYTSKKPKTGDRN